MFDVCDFESFRALNTWIDEFQSYALTNPRKQFVKMLLATKIDMLTAKERCVSREDAQAFALQNGNLLYHETSAKTSAGVEEAICKLSLEASNRLFCICFFLLS